MERGQVDLGVDEGRVDVAVSEQVGDRLQRLPVLEHSRGEAVAETMRTCSGRVHTRFMHVLGDPARKRGGLQPRPDWRNHDGLHPALPMQV